MGIPNLLNLNFLAPFVAHKIDSSKAIRGLRGMPRRLCIVGQVADDARITAGNIVGISSSSQAVELLGEGSQLLTMWRAAKENAGLGLPIDVIALHDDSTGVKALGGIAITGATDASGTFAVYIGGKRVQVGISKGMSLAVVCENLFHAINNTPSLPVKAISHTNGEIVLECRWKGITGNDIDVRVNYFDDDLTPDGLTVEVTPMATGAVNPDVSPAIAAMDNYRATEIVSAFTDDANMALWETELNKRWDFEDMRDGQLCIGVRGTEGELVAFAADRNNAQVHTIATKSDLTSPWETAAMAAAAIESSSATDPALPYTGITLSGYVPARQEDELKLEQKNILLQNGLSPLNIGGGVAELWRMVTNYRETSLGASDGSLRNLNWIKTLSYYRWFVTTEFMIKYRGYKLAEYIDEPLPGQKVMTKELGEEIMLNLYDQLLDVAIMQNVDHYRKTLQVEVDGPNGKLKIIDEPVLVTQHYQTEVTSQYAAGHV